MRRRRACSMMICNNGNRNYLHWIDSAWSRTARKRFLEVPSFLAAAEFLGYATHLKLVRFGVLDDLRRH
jgi:hypothetical protein